MQQRFKKTHGNSVHLLIFQVPVLATNSGGPTESVLHEATGWLLPSDDGVAAGVGNSGGDDCSAAEAWSRVMAGAAADEDKCARMGRLGR